SEALQRDAAVTVSGSRAVRPATGRALRCRGWRQEGLLRMLENTIAIGERPQDLVIYGGAAQAARNWECYDAIVAALRDLGDDETKVRRSLEAGYLRTATADIDEAVRSVRDAAGSGRALSVGLHANAAEALPRLHGMGFRPDIVTDQTAAHDALEGYIPAGLS